MQLWKGEVQRSKQRSKIALRRSLRYRWRLWQQFRVRYKSIEYEDFGDELDRKIQSLEKLQLLIQTHISPNPSPKNAASATPAAGNGTSGSPSSAAATLTTSSGKHRKHTPQQHVLPSVLESETSESFTSEAADIDAAAGDKNKEDDEMDEVPPPPAESPLTRSQKNSSTGKFGSSSNLNINLNINTSGKHRNNGSGGIAGGSIVSSSGVISGISTKDSRSSGGIESNSFSNGSGMPDTAKMRREKQAQRRSLVDQVDTSIRNTLTSFKIAPMQVSM